MQNDESVFNTYVIKSILANNRFGIKDVTSLESIKSIFFITEEYPIIEHLIKEGDIDSIKALSESNRTQENISTLCGFVTNITKDLLLQFTIITNWSKTLKLLIYTNCRMHESSLEIRFSDESPPTTPGIH